MNVQPRGKSSTIEVSAARYRATLELGPRTLHVRHGAFEGSFAMDVACDTLDRIDAENVTLGVQTRRDSPDGCTVEWTLGSSLWLRKRLILEFHEDAIELAAAVNGSGRLDRVIFFRRHRLAHYPLYDPRIRHLNDGGCPDPLANTVGTPSPLARIYCPEPNSYARWWFEGFEPAQISPHADLDFCGGNFIFNPGPLCFVGETNCTFVALGICAPRGNRQFTEYAHLGGRDLGCALNYWGYPAIDGGFTTPTLRLGFAQDLESAFAGYRDSLVAKRLVPTPTSSPTEWWQGPVISGWGEQCYMGDLFRTRSARPKDDKVYMMCTQRNYAGLVERINSTALPWRILVIDARWTVEGGTKRIDEGRWPDMRGFVDRLHAQGKKVLIWWGAWEHAGLPPAWCIQYDPDQPSSRRNRPGRFAKFGASGSLASVAPDPCHPAFESFIANRIRFFLSDEEGCCNADGFKVDHVSATPGYYGLRFPDERSEQQFGLDLLHRHLLHLYQTAKAVKPDALIIGQTPNPYFIDCQDLVRLGDIYSGTQSVVSEMLERARIVRLVHPQMGIDTDGWPMPSTDALLEYAAVQPGLGVPSLYYASGLDTTGEPLPLDFLDLLACVWSNRRGVSP